MQSWSFQPLPLADEPPSSSLARGQDLEGGTDLIFMAKQSVIINSIAAKTMRSCVTCERLAKKDPLSFQRDTASQLV